MALCDHVDGLLRHIARCAPGAVHGAALPSSMMTISAMSAAWSPMRSMSVIIFSAEDDQAQVPGHGLLHAAAAAGTGHSMSRSCLVHRGVGGHDAPGPSATSRLIEGLAGALSMAAFDHGAHVDHLPVQLFQLSVKTPLRIQPNLPVM